MQNEQQFICVFDFYHLGICPLNENIFQEHEFAPSIPPDRPDPTDPMNDLNGDDDGFLNESLSGIAALEEVIDSARTSTPVPMDESSNMSVASAKSDMSVEVLNATIENIRPYPKAAARKRSNRRRKTRKSEILTSSPVMKQLREEQEKSSKKKADAEAKKNS